MIRDQCSFRPGLGSNGIDAAQLSTQVAEAKQAGAIVIAYDRLIKNTQAVDYYVAYDNFKVGELQGQALLDGMKAKKPDGPCTIELFSGSPDDNNSAASSTAR